MLRASRSHFLSNYLKALPRWISDIDRDFGSDIYERMTYDPIVYSSISLLVLACLADGYRVIPAIEDKTDPDYEMAEEYAEFVQRNCEGLDGCTFEQFMWDMLWNGLVSGHKVAEQVYRNGEDEDKGKLVWRALKTKPREATGFVVDAYMNLVGLLGLIPGQGFPVLVGSIVANPSVLPNLLPTEKFIIFTHQMKNNDPRGTAVLRYVYNPWFLKMQTWPEYIRFLAVTASPWVVGFTAQEAVSAPPSDFLGNATGAPIITPEQNMANALAQLRNNSAAAFPYGAKVQMIQASGDGQVYKVAIDLFDGQIVQGILYAKLATMEGEHQARAASETHKDILSFPISHLKQEFSNTITNQGFRPLIRYNYGDEAAKRLCPRLSLGKIDQSDWHTDAESIAKLVMAKFLAPSQYSAIDERLNLPPRTESPEEMMAIVQGGANGTDGDPAPPKPGSKDTVASPKNNNQTPKGGKRVPGDSTPFSDDPTLGWELGDIRERFGLNEQDEKRARVLIQSLRKTIDLARRRPEHASV